MIWGVRITAARGNLVAVCGFYSFFEERNKEGISPFFRRERKK